MIKKIKEIYYYTTLILTWLVVLAAWFLFIYSVIELSFIITK